MANNRWARHTFVWVLLVLAAIFIWFTFIGNRPPADPIDAKQLADDVKSGKVTRIVTQTGSNDIEITYVSNPREPKQSRLPDNVSVFDLLKSYGINDLSAYQVKIETK